MHSQSLLTQRFSAVECIDVFHFSLKRLEKGRSSNRKENGKREFLLHQTNHTHRQYFSLVKQHRRIRSLSVSLSRDKVRQRSEHGPNLLPEKLTENESDAIVCIYD